MEKPASNLADHQPVDDTDLDWISPSSEASSSMEEEEEEESGSVEEVTSCASPSAVTADPLNDMSSLLQQLPIKRGLSRHYQGRSQSFTSLSDVRCLEDLAKRENPYNKKLKPCRSYGRLLGTRRSSPPKTSSRHTYSKKALRATSSPLLNAKRNNNGSFLSSRPPPIPLPRCSSTTTANVSTRTFLFA